MKDEKERERERESDVFANIERDNVTLRSRRIKDRTILSSSFVSIRFNKSTIKREIVDTATIISNVNTYCSIVYRFWGLPRTNESERLIKIRGL